MQPRRIVTNRKNRKAIKSKRRWGGGRGTRRGTCFGTFLWIQTERKGARENTTNKSARALYFSMDYVDDICERVSRPIQNLIGIIPWKLHALQRSEELCNRRSNRNSATQHAHKFIFYRRMHYASFRHILAAVFALLHFTRIKMNRRVLLCNVFLIVRVTDRFCKRPLAGGCGVGGREAAGEAFEVLSATLFAYFSFFTASIPRIYWILFIIRSFLSLTLFNLHH